MHGPTSIQAAPRSRPAYHHTRTLLQHGDDGALGMGARRQTELRSHASPRKQRCQTRARLICAAVVLLLISYYQLALGTGGDAADGEVAVSSSNTAATIAFAAAARVHAVPCKVTRRACTTRASWCRMGIVVSTALMEGGHPVELCCTAGSGSACDAARIVTRCRAQHDTRCRLPIDAERSWLTRRRWMPWNMSIELLNFIHIPKTGGTAVKGVLAEWGAQNAGGKVGGHELDFLALSAAQQAQYAVLWGHRGVGIHRHPDYKLHKLVRYVTILRHPVAKVVSQYDFEWGTRSSQCQSGREQLWVNCVKPSFSTWFHMTRLKNEGGPWAAANNPMTRQLCCWWSPFPIGSRPLAVPESSRSYAHPWCGAGVEGGSCGSTLGDAHAFVWTFATQRESSSTGGLSWVAAKKHTVVLDLGSMATVDAIVVQLGPSSAKVEQIGAAKASFAVKGGVLVVHITDAGSIGDGAGGRAVFKIPHVETGSVRVVFPPASFQMEKPTVRVGVRIYDYEKGHSEENCPPSRATLQCAKAQIDRFLMVGIQERLVDSIDLLKHRLGIVVGSAGEGEGAAAAAKVASIKVVNKHSGQKYRLRAEEEEQVRMALDLDLELYAYAKAKFEVAHLEMKARDTMPLCRPSWNPIVRRSGNANRNLKGCILNIDRPSECEPKLPPCNARGKPVKTAHSLRLVGPTADNGGASSFRHWETAHAGMMISIGGVANLTVHRVLPAAASGHLALHIDQHLASKALRAFRGMTVCLYGRKSMPARTNVLDTSAAHASVIEASSAWCSDGVVRGTCCCPRNTTSAPTLEVAKLAVPLGTEGCCGLRLDRRCMHTKEVQCRIADEESDVANTVDSFRMPNRNARVRHWQRTREVRDFAQGSASTTSVGAVGVALLEDPIARVRAQYALDQRNAAVSMKMSFLTWFHTRTVREGSGALRNSENPLTRKLCCSRRSEVVCPLNRDTLRCAKRRVESFIVVGLEEKLTESTALLRHCTNAESFRVSDAAKRRRDTLPRVRGGGAYTLSAEEELHVRDALAYDLALYVHAKKIFLHQLLEMRAGGVRPDNPSCTGNSVVVMSNKHKQDRTASRDLDADYALLILDQSAGCPTLPSCDAGGAAVAVELGRIVQIGGGKRAKVISVEPRLFARVGNEKEVDESRALLCVGLDMPRRESPNPGTTLCVALDFETSDAELISLHTGHAVAQHPHPHAHSFFHVSHLLAVE